MPLIILFKFKKNSFFAQIALFFSLAVRVIVSDIKILPDWGLEIFLAMVVKERKNKGSDNL